MNSLKLLIVVMLSGLLIGTPVLAQEKPAAPAKPDATGKDKADATKPDTAKPDKNAKPAAKTTTKPTPAKPGDKRASGATGTSPTDASVPGPADPSLPAPTVVGINTPVAEPNWEIDNIIVKPYGTASFNRDKISLSPVEGHSFVEVAFRVNALRPDTKAVENYAKLWKNVNRKELSYRVRSGARLFEMRHLALVDGARSRYMAIWNLDEAVRYNIYTAEFAPNSTRTSHQGFWKGNNDAGVPMKWLDSEQSFLTRTTRPPNRPEIVERVTYFSGILETQNPVEVNFLFSVPNDVDRETLGLAYENAHFAAR